MDKFKSERIGFLGLAIAAACVAVPSYESAAQSYPAKPIHLIVGFASGGGADVIARMLAQKLSENLGQGVIVENRAGSGGSIANERVATAAPDGYTLLLMGASATILPALHAHLSYDLERDLTPVSLVVNGPLILVAHPSVPVRNVKELIALARSKPGKLSYGSAGIGGSAHMSGALFNLMAKTDIVHVPYKGSSESVIATASGQVEISFPTIPPTLPLLEVGKLRALGVTTAKRTPLMPAVPALQEAVPGYSYSNWNGISAPAGIPKDVLMRLNAAIAKVANTPEMKEWFITQGVEGQTDTPEEFAAYIHREIAQNGKLIRLSGAKAD